MDRRFDRIDYRLSWLENKIKDIKDDVKAVKEAFMQRPSP